MIDVNSLCKCDPGYLMDNTKATFILAKGILRDIRFVYYTRLAHKEVKIK